MAHFILEAAMRFISTAEVERWRKHHTPYATSTKLSKKAAETLLEYTNTWFSEVLDEHNNLQFFEETKMNAINLLLAKNEQFKFVSVVFEINRDSSVQKKYTYKTILDVKENDLLVVPTAQGTFETVKAVAVNNIFEGNFDLKWVAAKLDLTHLEEVKAMEDELKSLFAEEEKRKRAEKETAQLEEYLGVEGVSKAELIAKKVRI